MKKGLINKCLSLFLVVSMLFAALPAGQVKAEAETIPVYVLEPSWTAPGGGGVWASYNPDDGPYESPGETAIYDGKGAGIIKAGITPNTDGDYYDQGLLGFKLNNVPLADFAAGGLTYDVQNQSGTNPVWVRIRIAGTSTTYQHVPESYGVGGGYHTINAGTGLWQLMDANQNGTGPKKTLNEFAGELSGSAIDRVYLTLGMGNSYNVEPGVGTVGWVDKVTIGETTYDFDVFNYCSIECYVDAATGNDANPGTEALPFKTIQKGIDMVAANGNVRVAAGTYVENIDINKVGLAIEGATDPSGTTPAVIQGLVTMSANDATLFNMKIAPGTVSGSAAAIFVIANNIYIEGNLIDGMYGDGTAQSRASTSLVEVPKCLYPFLQSSTTRFATSPTLPRSRWHHAPGQYLSAQIEGNTIEAISSTAGWAWGIEVTPSSGVPGIVPQQTYIKENIISDVAGPLGAAGLSVDEVSESFSADASQVFVTNNQFLTTSPTLAIVNKDEAHQLAASPNWFGTVAGPATGSIVGDATYSPWCGNAACSFLVDSEQATEVWVDDDFDSATAGWLVTHFDNIQAGVDAVANGGEVIVEEGIYTGTMIPADRDHLTITLLDGVEIEGEPDAFNDIVAGVCFWISGDYITIEAESIGGAKCTMNGYTNAIYLDGEASNGVREVKILGLEIANNFIPPSPSYSGYGGIYIDEYTTDVQIVNNFIHGFNYGIQMLNCDEEMFFEVKGNLLQNNYDFTDNCFDHTYVDEDNLFMHDLTYNSWGKFNGPEDAFDGEWYSYSWLSWPFQPYPWTHAAIELTSSKTTAFEVGEVFTVDVIGVMQNISLANFTLEYDPDG